MLNLRDIPSSQEVDAAIQQSLAESAAEAAETAALEQQLYSRRKAEYARIDERTRLERQLHAARRWEQTPEANRVRLGHTLGSVWQPYEVVTNGPRRATLRHVETHVTVTLPSHRDQIHPEDRHKLRCLTDEASK